MFDDLSKIIISPVSSYVQHEQKLTNELQLNVFNDISKKSQRNKI